MNLRQAVTFAILMQGNEGIMTKDPSYVVEKIAACSEMLVPEAILDSANRAIFQQYAERFGQDWDTYRDLGRPIAELIEGG